MTAAAMGSAPASLDRGGDHLGEERDGDEAEHDEAQPVRPADGEVLAGAHRGGGRRVVRAAATGALLARLAPCHGGRVAPAIGSLPAVPPRSAQSSDWREVLIAAAALETGLLAALEEARPVDQAADATGLDRRAARIVSTALVGLGYLEEDGDGLRATGRARALLAPAGDGADPAGELHLEARAMRSHLGLEETLRSGRPVDDVSGGDRATVERFMRAMRNVAAPRARAQRRGPRGSSAGRAAARRGRGAGHLCARLRGRGMGRDRARPARDPGGGGPGPARRGDRDGRGRRHARAARLGLGRGLPGERGPPVRSGHRGGAGGPGGGGAGPRRHARGAGGAGRPEPAGPGVRGDDAGLHGGRATPTPRPPIATGWRRRAARWSAPS